jgi:hypothetical protein
LGRNVLLASVLERVIVGDRTIELANFEFNDALHPAGYTHLKDFDYHLAPPRPFVQFIYQIDDLEISKRVSMVHGHDLVVIDYDASMGQDRAIQ